MTSETPQTTSKKLNMLLTNLSEKGDFPVAILTDRHGLLIAFAATVGQDTQTQAAVVALIENTATQVQNLLNMAQADEISLNDQNGQRLICRPFNINDQVMILAILVPNKEQSYRRLTNQTINNIQRQWKL